MRFLRNIAVLERSGASAAVSPERGDAPARPGSVDAAAPARDRRPLWLAAALLCFWGLVLLGTFAFPASALDEGTLVAYPSRMLSGDVPHRDFQTLYGPANLWMLAAAFKAFGASLGVERAVGLALRLLALGSAMWIGARFGRVAAVAGAALAAIVWLPLYAQANAALTALALTLLALALLAHAGTPAVARPARFAALAGAAAGLAVLVRFDFLPAVALALAPLLVAGGRAPRWAFVRGVLPMVALGAVHLALVGPDGIERVLRDIVDGASARDLPLPALGTQDGNLFAVSVLGAALASAVGLRAMRRRRDPRAALLAGLGLLVAGLLPYMSGRADVFHIATGGAVACLALACLGGYAGRCTGRTLAAGVAVALAAAVLAWQATDLDNARRIVAQPFGSGGGVPSVDVRYDDRSYRLAPTAGFALEPVLGELRRVSRPGQRLYVGPRDLRYAEYNDAYLYYLLPQLQPASFYLESNPGTVNGPRHDLAADLRRADFLVLNRDHDPAHPEIDERGSDEPNRVVARDFCRLRRSGTFELFARRGTRACE